ncbi:MAG: DMT family transporter [Bdellovibrionales bacterium]|jgi:drug/metabolite transporter (DMT)-like permease
MTALARVLKKHPHRAGLVFAILAAITFGVYPPVVRALYADGGNAIFMVLGATWARALSMALYCILTHAPLFRTREDKKQALIGGAFQTCSVFSVMLALFYLPGPIVIIIIFSHTIMLLFFMAWRGEIKLNSVNIATTILALLGLTLVLDLWHAQPAANWIGMAFAFITALVAVGRLYVYGKQTQKRKPIVVGAENFLVAAVLTLPALFFQTPHLPATLMGDVYALAGCLSVIFGSFFMFWGIGLLGSFQYSLMCKVEPIFTSIFSVILLNEILSVHQYVGIALTVGSLVAYQLLCRAKEKQVCAG